MHVSLLTVQVSLLTVQVSLLTVQVSLLTVSITVDGVDFVVVTAASDIDWDDSQAACEALGAGYTLAVFESKNQYLDFMTEFIDGASGIVSDGYVIYRYRSASILYCKNILFIHLKVLFLKRDTQSLNISRDIRFYKATFLD